MSPLTRHGINSRMVDSQIRVYVKLHFRHSRSKSYSETADEYQKLEQSKVKPRFVPANVSSRFTLTAMYVIRASYSACTRSSILISGHGLNLRLSQYGICSRPYSTLTRKLSRMRMIKRPETELDNVE